MTEHEAFLAAIREHPDDDTPREMYADWLTERGDPRGEFIRVQVERAKLDPYHLSCTGSKCVLATCNHLRQREQKLWNDSRDHRPQKWFYVDGWGVSCPLNDLVVEFHPSTGGIIVAHLRRGFVDEIRLTTDDFHEHAKAIFVSQPVTKVVLTDREPTQISPMANDELGMKPGQYRWFVTTSRDSLFLYQHWLPWALSPENAGKSKVFDTADLAHAWLSDLCVTRGREWAGLPPLKKENQS